MIQPLIGDTEELVDPTKEENLLMSNDPPMRKNTIFEVEAKSLHYLMGHDMYHEHL